MHPKAKKQDKRADTIERCKKYRTKAWSQIRNEIMARDGMECRLCGELCVGKGNAHVDHVVAVVNGGTDEKSNLRLLCQVCHSKVTAQANGFGR